MEQRVFKTIIGSSIVSAGATSPEALLDGQVGVYARNMVLTDEGTADNSVIYLVQGNTAGYPKWSDPIVINKATSYAIRDYEASANQVTDITIPAGATLAVGDQIFLHLLYKHNKDYWSERQEKYTYTVTVTAAHLAGVAADLIAAEFAVFINDGAAYFGTRTHVTATSAAAVLTLTGLDEIVNFEAILSNYDVAVGAVVYTTPGDLGNGTYRQVSDMEDYQKGWYGFDNRRKWPVDEYTLAATVGTCYDTIVLEHHNIASTGSIGSDAYVRNPLSTVIALEQGAASAALQVVLDALITI
jgi:hypothetical protein